MVDKQADSMVEIEYPGIFSTRKFRDQVMYNLRMCLTDVTTGCGLKDEKMTPNSVHITLEDEPNNADEDGC